MFHILLGVPDWPATSATESSDPCSNKKNDLKSALPILLKL